MAKLNTVDSRGGVNFDNNLERTISFYFDDYTEVHGVFTTGLTKKQVAKTLLDMVAFLAEEPSS